MQLWKRIGLWALSGLALTASLNSIGASEVVAVVSAQSPVTALSANQIADIFLGKARRFPDGTQAEPIDQAEGSPARDVFYMKHTGKSAAQIKAYWSKIIFTGRGVPPKEAASSAEVKKLIIENPNAIGYIEQSLVDGSVKVLGVP